MELDKNLVMYSDRRFLSRELASLELLNAVGVPEGWTEHVRVLDSNEDLALLHYISTQQSVDDQNVNVAKDIRHVRGTIVEKETGEIVCRSFPYTPEISVEDTDHLREVLPDPLSKVTFYKACEGTVLRVFWRGDSLGGEWCISTHRKIDASNSHWSGSTFGDMFTDTKNFALATLDRNICYVFLLSHNDNRLLHKIPMPQLMLIALYNRKEKLFMRITEDRVPVDCVLPEKVSGINKIEDLRPILEAYEQERSFKSVGLIAIADPTNPQPIKIVSSGYHHLRAARGNDPSLRTRYLQLRGTQDASLLVNWYAEPQYQEIFDNAEDEVDNLVKKLHSLYVNRYIKKNYDNVSKEEFVTIRRAHEWHMEDRAHNIVTAQKMQNFVNTTPNHYLLIMLGRQRNENRVR